MDSNQKCSICIENLLDDIVLVPDKRFSVDAVGGEPPPMRKYFNGLYCPKCGLKYRSFDREEGFVR